MSQEYTVNPTLIGLMRESGWTMRSIASVVILTFGSLMTLPAEAAIQQEIKQIQWHKSDASNAAKLSAKLEETHQFLTKLAAHNAKSLDLSTLHAQVHALEADLQSLDKGAMDEFAANEAHIKAHKLPEIIEQRQQDAVKTYRGRMDTLLTELKATDQATDTTTFMAHVSKAKAHLDAVQVKPFHEKFDPKNLPFSVAKPTGIKPRLTKKDYQARPVAPPKRAQVAANGSLIGILSAADVTGSLPTSPSDPSYVAATDDVQITPAIQAQAAALHNDPVQIFNWVHNNIEYVPSYGSIQGSDMTLQTLKGNDFDQANLLIALLRASNIPARYVYGTIQVPIAQVENWVGGVTDPNAALNLMSQGDIPVTGLVQGGQIKYAQLEHVWVEAWVNFIPSQAARPGPGNTWVSMDASFKQYIYAQGMNPLQSIPFDAGSIIDHTVSTATINGDPSNTSIGNIDQAYLQQQASLLATNAATYVNSLSAQTTYAQLVGTKIPDQRSASALPASLPYLQVVVGQRLAALPDNLRYKFQYELDDQNGNPVFSYSADTDNFDGAALGLEFSPATAADQLLLQSYLPTSTNGAPIDSSQYPNSLPGYLVEVVPTLTLNGQPVATTTAASAIGSAMQSKKGYWVTSGSWVPSIKPITAGQYQAIVLDLQGVSLKNVSNFQASIQSTVSGLLDPTSKSFSAYQIVGTMLECSGLSYFAANDSADQIASKASGIASYRQPSFGTFSTVIAPIFSFGIATAVKMPGFLMDMDGMRSAVVSFDNSSQTAAFFNMISGSRLSTYESLVPTQLFRELDPTAQNVSAVVAMQSSLESGQKIYDINSQDISNVLPTLNLGDAVATRIQNAVAAGETVMAPQSSVTIGNWTGTGYVVLDQSTGDGAYEINGGANGNQTDTDNDTGSMFAMNSFGIGMGGGSLIGAGLSAALDHFLDGLFEALDISDINGNCSGSNLVAAASIYALFGGVMYAFQKFGQRELELAALAGFIGPIGLFVMEVVFVVLILLYLIHLAKMLENACRGQPIGSSGNDDKESGYA